MPPFRHHLPLDNSTTLDSEDLDYRDSSFDSDLRDDMAVLSLDDLRKLYPELVFARHSGKKEKGHDFTEHNARSIYTYADWRKV